MFVCSFYWRICGPLAVALYAPHTIPVHQIQFLYFVVCGCLCLMADALQYVYKYTYVSIETGVVVVEVVTLSA